MKFNDFQNLMLPAVDREIRSIIDYAALGIYNDLRELILYQLGYDGDLVVAGKHGKRIRPLLTLLTAKAAGGNWENALPAAAAVELIHNFSLIHDDIEDRSETRRGRETVWKKWGVPLAINAGDAMYALAFSALARLSETSSEHAALSAFVLMTKTSIRLTGGQHLDISFENADTLPMESYWSMISGKTAALLSASVQLGAIAANAPLFIVDKLELFAHSLGLSFQIQDDCLGIWGSSGETGKSNANDIATRKKTLPIIFGLRKDENFASAWRAAETAGTNYDHLANLLAEEGARAFAEGESNRLTIEAMRALDEIGFGNDAGDALKELATTLLNRRY